MNLSVLLGKSQHYYPSLCGHCHQPGTDSAPLKRCSGCRSVYYCSADHQKKDRRRHRKLCQYIAANYSQLFADYTGKSRQDWVKKNTRNYQLYHYLEEQDEPFFLFPPVCRQTGCFSLEREGGKLLTCPDCLSVSWCSQSHQAQAAQQHQQFCFKLKLSRIADCLENKHDLDIIIPALPDHLDQKYQGTPSTKEDQVQHLLGLVSENGFKDYGVEDLDPVMEVLFLSDLLSGPYTLLESGHKFLPDMAHRETLKVHIAGSSIYESVSAIKWEYLAHRLPALKSLEIMFIGPKVNQTNNNTTVQEETCENCSKLGRSIAFGHYSMTYQQFRDLAPSSTPDLVLIQNCGFHEYSLDSEGWKDGWAGLGSLLHPSGAPVIFTSYTRTEAVQDLQRFQEQCGQAVELLVECEENKMRSYRPRRDMGIEEEVDVFYNNHFISILKAK